MMMMSILYAQNFILAMSNYKFCQWKIELRFTENIIESNFIQNYLRFDSTKIRKCSFRIDIN